MNESIMNEYIQTAAMRAFPDLEMAFNRIEELRSKYYRDNGLDRDNQDVFIKNRAKEGRFVLKQIAKKKFPLEIGMKNIVIKQLRDYYSGEYNG